VPVATKCETVTTYVASSASFSALSDSGAHRLCVRENGKITDVSTVTLDVKDCSELCPSSRAGSCDQGAGKCVACNSHFTGQFCQNCSAGHTGTDCLSCETSKNFHCNVEQNSSSYCPLNATCATCGCNGHFNPYVADRCPNNKCICATGYTGDQCQECLVGFLKNEVNASYFSCDSCSALCNNHASACTLSTCECTNNFDPETKCKSCLGGHVYDNATDSCRLTNAPTTTPTTSPTMSPTVSPTGSPTPPVSKCSGKTDSGTYTTQQCTTWTTSSYCTSSTYAVFMTTHCDLSCCEGTKTQSPTLSPTDVCAKLTDDPIHQAKCGSWTGQGFCTNSDYKDFMGQSCTKACCQAAVTITAPTSGPTPVPTPAVSSGCSAYADGTVYSTIQCNGWQAAGYCASSNGYYSFMQTHCQKTCCSKEGVGATAPTAVPTTATAPTAGPASNECGFYLDGTKYSTTQCNGWKAAGYCASSSSYSSFMQANCQKTCCSKENVVAPTTAPATGGCTGQDSTRNAAKCSGWVALNYCTSSIYQSFVNTECKRSCCEATTATTACTKENSATYVSQCTGWKDIGYCASSSAYYSFMLGSCAKTCCEASGKCASASDNKIYDGTTKCVEWAQVGYCASTSNFNGYMQDNCAKTCCQN